MQQKLCFCNKFYKNAYHEIEVKTVDTRELFARLIKCEAGGEGIEGMRAVATVVMNRVRVDSGEYRRLCEGSLRKVIIQACQFSCYKTRIGGVDNPQNVWAATPEDVHFQVADWAMNGGIYAGVSADCLWYMNPFSSQCPNFFPYNQTGYWFTRVNQHCFYNPMPAYAKT